MFSKVGSMLIFYRKFSSKLTFENFCLHVCVTWRTACRRYRRRRGSAALRRVVLRCLLRCVAVCCSVMQCVAVCYSVTRCVAVCCSVLHMLQCVAVNRRRRGSVALRRVVLRFVLRYVTVCCSVLHVLQCVAVCCSD